MRYFIKMAYDGSKFYGFQRQSSKKTVQGELEKAISLINKNFVFIKGAGRTDVGVHAMGQCAHFDLDKNIPAERLLRAINSIVHPYIHVFLCKQVDDTFHARFSVQKKCYVYKIWRGSFQPFREDYYWQIDKNIDVKKLKECAHIFVGSYDFHNFVSGYRENYQAILYDVKVKIIGEEIKIVFEGKSFYRYMVRNLVGAMLDYTFGKCELREIERMVKEENFNKQLSTAPARGLYLENIFYEPSFESKVMCSED